MHYVLGILNQVNNMMKKCNNNSDKCCECSHVFISPSREPCISCCICTCVAKESCKGKDTSCEDCRFNEDCPADCENCNFELYNEYN